MGLPDPSDESDGSVVRKVPQAGNLRPEGRPALNVRIRDVRASASCYAYHKTQGFDRRQVKKPRPITAKIDAKLKKDWVKTWIRNPRAVKQTTWMPRI